MTAFLYAAAAVLLLNLLAGLARALIGPTLRDRLAAFLLLGTTGVALLLMVASASDVAALRDAAIGVVALATLVVVVRLRAEATG